MLLNDIILKMIAFDQGDSRRIQHFLKVYEFARLIGEQEGLEGDALLTLEIASILHDIGIHPAEDKFGSCNGKLQEQEGPACARALLSDFPELDAALVDRVCFLISHHHTYNQVDGLDYQILLEADFLVNAYEDSLSDHAILSFRDRVFRTRTGCSLLSTMFLEPRTVLS